MIQKSEYGYIIKKNDNYLHIVFYNKAIVRFVYTKDDRLPKSTQAVIAEKINIDAEIKDNIIKTEQLQINIDKKYLTLKVFDNEGNLISCDKNVDFNNRRVEKHHLYEKGYYGLGEKYEWINRINTSTTNWNSDVIGLTSLHNSVFKEYHTAIPFFIGMDESKSYGIFFDNTFRTEFDFNIQLNKSFYFRSEGGHIDYYLICGGNVSDIVKGYTYLTGRMNLPRKDFLGYHQCRYSYMNRDELMSVAKKMREKNIPCDVLYLDIDYMKNYKVFTIDSQRFNDFKDMVKKLEEMGFKLVTIIDPGVKKEEGYSVYEEGMENNYFIKDAFGEVYVGEVWPGDSVFPDFLRSKVRKWWGELHKSLLDKGVEGIWNDMNEPANFSTQSKTIPKDTVHINDEGERKLHSEIHNIYGMLEAQATYHGIINHIPNKRPFILTRSAYSGTQRYSGIWAGDNTSTWEHLESSIPMNLNLGLSGFSYTGSDVGGHCGDCTAELLIRWTQLGAFIPLFRNHTVKDSIRQEPWCFGEDALKIIRKYIRLRYKYITYLYNLMRESSINGNPVIRPLFYHYQNDENTYNINDQFLFGENMMICPITRPGQSNRMVYLPKGEWYDYWTEERITGGRNIITQADIDVIPIYVKGGSIIPRDEVREFIDVSIKSFNIDFYVGESGSYSLYLDDGISFDYIKGKYSIIHFQMESNNNEINIIYNIEKNKYTVPNIKIYIHGNDNTKTILVNNKKITGSCFKLKI